MRVPNREKNPGGPAGRDDENLLTYLLIPAWNLVFTDFQVFANQPGLAGVGGDEDSGLAGFLLLFQ